MIRLESIGKQNGKQIVFIEASAGLQRGEKNARRRRDPATHVAALGVNQIDGERGTHTTQQHRALAACMRGEHGEEAVDTQLVGMRIRNLEIAEGLLRAREGNAPRALRQRQ